MANPDAWLAHLGPDGAPANSSAYQAYVTAADGAFRFDNLPPGRYTLVVWHERFGTKQQRVRVDAQVETRVELTY